MKITLKMFNIFVYLTILDTQQKIWEVHLFALYEHFSKYLKKDQHGLIWNRNVLSNILDSDPESDIVADYSKAIDKVQQKNLIIKLSQIGVGGCLLSKFY